MLIWAGMGKSVIGVFLSRISILMSLDMMEASLYGMLLDKVYASVCHVVIVGGSDGWVEIFIGFPFVHSDDEGFVIAVELD